MTGKNVVHRRSPCDIHEAMDPPSCTMISSPMQLPRIHRFPALLALGLSFVGCDKKDTPESSAKPETEAKKTAGDADAKETAGEAEAKSARSGPAEIEARSLTIERGRRRATVRTQLPADWEEDRGGFQPPTEVEGIWQPRFGVAFGDFSCTGGCKDEDFERERDGVLERAKDRLAGPNLNTGKPELDELRLEVTEIEKGELPGGGYVAHRVAIPEGVEGPYFEGINATCSRFRSGDDGYIVATVRIPKVAEKEVGSLLLDACKAAEIDGALEKD
jgi:hypothetical protein